jgi:dihydroorotate dehydrogenase electron transfer subunit
MMKALVPILDKARIPSQYLLERYMKCGIGICGSCAMDPNGFRVCIDGPVVDDEKLKTISEFGAYHRDASGRVEGVGGCQWSR